MLSRFNKISVMAVDVLDSSRRQVISTHDINYVK